MDRDEHNPAYIPGPLDELVPGLRKRAERLPALPVHPRVVRATADDGAVSLVLASFTPAANLRAYHAALKPIVEAALLVELCGSSSERGRGYVPPCALELYAFSEPSFDPAPALRAFGFERADLLAPAARKALSMVRREAQLVEGAPVDEPLMRFTARVRGADHPALTGLDAELQKAQRGAWGEEPGGLARALAEALEVRGFPGVAPTRAGIEALEALVVSREPGVVRFIAPLAFQGLCDLIALAAHVTWGREVEWGVCEPDPDTGLSPPPVIRVTRDAESFHVPLAQHVLRWCVMPVQMGENVPTLGAWAEHEFT